MIEVEIRAFIDENKYEELLKFYKGKKNKVLEERQITTYFKGDKDFRLMLTKDYAQLWLKDGEIHDDAREELVVKVDNEYKGDLQKMLGKLGYSKEIKWYRVRNSLTWHDIYVTIDYTHGYGYIIELEKQVESDADVDKAKSELIKLFEMLEVSVTEKAEFKNKYEDYKINWEEYTKDIDEGEFLK